MATLFAIAVTCFDQVAQYHVPRHSGRHSLVSGDARAGKNVRMNINRQIIVFDAADLAAESAFWAGVLGGRVVAEADWHSVVDADGKWRIGVQLAPDHVPPEWPHGNAQQIHLDLHVDDLAAAHDEVVALGARLLKGADTAAAEGFQVYADPAGHPFCLCWGS
ncbi:MAG: hypothetical protein RJA49_762 [Actinomycetota bacterium]